MIKTTFFICLLISALAFTFSNIVQQVDLSEMNTQITKPTNLKFIDYIGSGITDQQVASFKISITKASNYFENDIQQNLDYIRNYMNHYQGNGNQNYVVFIEQSVSTSSNYAIFSKGGSSLASFKGINPQYPNWSYLFAKTVVSSTTPFSFVSFIAKGDGINAQLETFIYQAIKTYEPNRTCNCSGTASIQNRMNQYDNQRWNVICDDSYDVAAYFYSLNQQWMYVRPQNCYYLLFVL